MIKVSDDRLGPEVNLCKLDIGDTFIWNEYPMIRLDFGKQESHHRAVKDEHIPCMVISGGEYIELNRLAWVTPIKCELTIVE